MKLVNPDVIMDRIHCGLTTRIGFSGLTWQRPVLFQIQTRLNRELSRMDVMRRAVDDTLREDLVKRTRG